jgi:peptide-methionine (S)-S-oxide reductase
MEAVFEDLKGVISVESGYAGGHVKAPSYRMVCEGTSGHAEVVQVVFDPMVLPLATVLTVFFQMHDPTTLNRQGADVGTQYRSVIFFETEEQQRVAIHLMKVMEEQKLWPSPMVTEVLPLPAFWPAESKHQNYFARNREQGYCQAVIAPKLKKLKTLFPALRNSEN